MKPIPDEKQIEELLTSSSLQIGNRLGHRLSHAPWTEHAVARRRFMSAASLVTLLLVLTIAITPQGRAFAQSFLYLFIRANGDTIAVPTSQPMNWVEVTPGMPHPTVTPMPTLTPLVAFAEDCGSFPIMSCSVEQIRSKVDFIVKEPTSLPAGLYFTGATGGPEAVYLRFEYENNSGALFVAEERWLGRPDQGEPRIGASAVIEDVQVGDLAGQYFKGSFVQQSGDAQAKWDPNFQVETLRWVDHGVSYTLEYNYTIQGPLGKDGLIAIAKSMTTAPVVKLPMPATPKAATPVTPDPSALTITKVEKQAGFKLMLPARVPASLTSYTGASYDPSTRIATVWFTADQVNLNGLYVSQEIVSEPDDCDICDAFVGDGPAPGQEYDRRIIGANSNLQTVRIGGVTGKYFEGVMLGSGQWDPLPDIKHLRWRANGRGFELVSLGTDLQKEDLIAIAESLTFPAPTPAQDAFERWDPRTFWNLSLSEAEGQAGYKLTLPILLPEVLQYFGARYDGQSKIVSVYYKLEESLTEPNDNGLVLRQQVMTDPSHCDLCDFLVGDLNSLKNESEYVMIVSSDADLETVQIGDVTGKYVEGNWQGTDCCGWVWEPEPYFKFLRWQKNGRAFELFYMGGEIQKEDMVRIAESVK